MKKKVISLMVATVIMALGTFTANAFAATDEESSGFEGAKSAVMTSLQNAESVSAPSDEYLILYTKTGNKLGYLLPLEENGSSSGYAVIIAKDGVYQTLTISEGELSAETVSILKSKEMNGKIIYDFPFNFLVTEDNGKNMILTENNALVAAEDLDAVMNASEHSVDLDQYMSSLTMQKVQPTADMEIARLRNWQKGSFVNVGAHYYGGYQDWLHSKLSGSRQVTQFYADRACGVAAANNVAIYLSQNMSGKANLYNRGTPLSVASCTENMRDIYDYITPAVWGIPTIDTLKSKFEEFAAARGVSVTGHRSTDGWSKDTVLQYIGGGLIADTPVLLLTWNTPVAELGTHWVTITRIYKESSLGANFMTTSNWGEMKTYNFDAWFDAGSIYQGVIYFQ